MIEFNEYNDNYYKNIDHLLYDQDGTYRLPKYIFRDLCKEVGVKQKTLVESLGLNHENFRVNMHFLTFKPLELYTISKYFNIDAAVLVDAALYHRKLKAGEQNEENSN